MQFIFLWLVGLQQGEYRISTGMLLILSICEGASMHAASQFPMYYYDAYQQAQNWWAERLFWPKQAQNFTMRRGPTSKAQARSIWVEHTQTITHNDIYMDV